MHLAPEIAPGSNTHPNHASDLRPSEIGAFEAIYKGDSYSLRDLQFVGVLHHRNLLLGVFTRKPGLSAGELHDSLFGILVTTNTNEPPGGLGSQEDTDEDRNRPDPLG